jgi:hypothetical protein
MTQIDDSVGTVRLLDPTGIIKERRQPIAPRLDTLDGKVMGVVDDGLGNSHVLLDALADELAGRFAVKRGPRVVKPSLSSPLPDGAFADMLTEVDFVLVGVGL